MPFFGLNIRQKVIDLSSFFYAVSLRFCSFLSLLLLFHNQITFFVMPTSTAFLIVMSRGMQYFWIIAPNIIHSLNIVWKPDWCLSLHQLLLLLPSLPKPIPFYSHDHIILSSELLYNSRLPRDFPFVAIYYAESIKVIYKSFGDIFNSFFVCKKAEVGGKELFNI